MGQKLQKYSIIHPKKLQKRSNTQQTDPKEQKKTKLEPPLTQKPASLTSLQQIGLVAADTTSQIATLRCRQAQTWHYHHTASKSKRSPKGANNPHQKFSYQGKFSFCLIVVTNQKLQACCLFHQIFVHKSQPKQSLKPNNQLTKYPSHSSTKSLWVQAPRKIRIKQTKLEISCGFTNQPKQIHTK